MKKEKLLYITPIPPPYGGIAVLCQSILNAGLKKQFDVIQLNTTKKALREKIDSVRIIGVINSIKNYIKLIRICSKNKDVRYAFLTGTSNLAIIRDYIYIIILKIFKIKPIFYLHGTRKLPNSSFIIRLISKKAMNASTYILSPTKVDFESAKKISNNPEKVKLFYNSTIVKVNIMQKYNISPIQNKPLKIIGIGRLSDAKGAFDLLNVCINLLNESYAIQLYWIGRGAYEADDRKAEAMIKRQDDIIQKNIFLLKDLTEDEKFNYLSQADIFILPTKNDNLPISILEAMAFGLPVISTYMGAIPEVIINNKNGWLIKHSDNNLLKEAIIKAISSKKLFSEISIINKQDFIQNFDSSNRVIEITSLIAEMNSKQNA